MVTLVAPVHLEYFDSLAGIARAKYELIESLPPRWRVAVLNADDEYVSQFGRDSREGGHVRYSERWPMCAPRGLRTWGLGTEFDVLVNGQRERAKLPLLGDTTSRTPWREWLWRDRGIPLSAAVAALLSMKPTDKRGEVLEMAARR